jgi:hypothetical protein
MADYDADSRTGAAGAQPLCALQEPHAQGHSPAQPLALAPGRAGCRLAARGSTTAEAQDTHFSLELFEVMSRRVNAVLALGTTDHVLPSPTRVSSTKSENFPRTSWERNFPAPSLWQLRYIQSFSIDWRGAVGMCSVIR